MSALVVAALALAVVAFLIAAVALLRLRHVQRSFEVLWGEDGANSGDIASVLARQDAVVAAAERRLEAARREAVEAQEQQARALRNVALVRYDAFGDAAGRLSFSAAILNDGGDGLVISSIHARGEAWTYAKAIAGGKSSQELTPEEKQAITEARKRRGSRHKNASDDASAADFGAVHDETNRT